MQPIRHRLRVRWSSFVLALLPLTLCAQHYRVRLCPGPVAPYQKLDSAVRKLQDSDVKTNEAKLRQYLTTWDREVREKGIERYQVEIRYPDKRVRFWQSDKGNKPGFFNASVSAAAGRGGLNTVAKQGDNQRCFFQDTTVVLDTLRIRLGDFSPDTRFTLSVAQKNYPLPLSGNRSEVLLYAGLLPVDAMGRYLHATVTIGGEMQPVTFYFLSPDDRAQLVRSLRASMAEDPVSCRDLPDQLVTYTTRNWGGKQCVSPALYLSAQRQVIKNLLRTERINCAP